MNTAARPQQLIDQGLALDAYLDALLERAEARSSASGMNGAAVGANTARCDDPLASRFQARLIEVAGLTLAVPLAQLADLLPMPDVPPPAGAPPLVIGEFAYRGGRVRVVDTARLILPAERAAALDRDAGERSRHLVVIDAGRWALACSRIGDVIEVGSAEITRRGPGSRRQWLAGTLTGRRCALLDVDGLIRELTANLV
jgi:purine-binding chemotaxis protein CheW